MRDQRLFGVLMPVSALPSGEGIGTFGEGAYAFVDYLKTCGASVWQVLPLVPTGFGDSPYQSACSSALSCYFIDLQSLISRGLLTAEEVSSAHLQNTPRRVSYELQFTQKIPLLRRAFSRFRRKDERFQTFLAEGGCADFAQFMTLKCHFGHRPWTEWGEYVRYDERLVNEFVAAHLDEYFFWQFTQFEALNEWQALKRYANQNGVQVMGDLPLYLAYDSVEMWKYGGELFQVDGDRRMSCVAGVPPDAFSDEGQLWGNPLYDWEAMQQNGYAWWNDRIDRAFKLYDAVRIDHFRGFDRYYSVCVGESTAKSGEWISAPGRELFWDKRHLSIVAEDLGIIDDGVRELMQFVGYPGMKILQFGFDGTADNWYEPSSYPPNCVCYTGTHDNATLKQYLEGLSEGEWEVFVRTMNGTRERFNLPSVWTREEAVFAVIELGFASNANAFILPFWDALELGGDARFNTPSTVCEQNWSYRFLREDLRLELAEKLKNMTERYGRNM